MIKRYVLVNPKNGYYIAIDPHGGGYPHEVDQPIHAMLWRDREPALRYIAIFSSDDYEKPTYELHEVIVTTHKVEQITGEDLKNLRQMAPVPIKEREEQEERDESSSSPCD